MKYLLILALFAVVAYCQEDSLSILGSDEKKEKRGISYDPYNPMRRRYPMNDVGMYDSYQGSGYTSPGLVGVQSLSGYSGAYPGNVYSSRYSYPGQFTNRMSYYTPVTTAPYGGFGSVGVYGGDFGGMGGMGGYGGMGGMGPMGGMGGFPGQMGMPNEMGGLGGYPGLRQPGPGFF